jgi:hypothetical protein
MLAPLFMGQRRPRVALIASTPRSREYGRRALRLLGCVPLIFLNMVEFLEMGSRSRELSMVFLEHPDDDADEAGTSTVLGDSVREIVGEDLPIIHSFPAQSGGAIPGFRANDMLLPASLSFAQLCRTLRGFLQKHDLPTRDAHLEWGVHRFCIESGMVYVNGAAVPLKPEEFDLALELFFNAGARVSRPWLRTMIPALQTLRRRPTAPAADATVLRLRDMLGLQAKHGWDLQVNPGLSCTLVRADCLT